MKVESDKRPKDNPNLKELILKLKIQSDEYKRMTKSQMLGLVGKRAKDNIESLKKEIEKQTKQLSSKQNKEPETKTISKPKHFKINGSKVLIPSQIRLFDFNGYLVFGDSSLKNATIDKDSLEHCKANKEIIVLLKTPKQKNGSNCYAFSEKMDIVRSYRKMRLANAVHLQVIGEATNQPHQTKDEFIKSEFESELQGKELEDAYLLSENTNLIIKDIIRLVHLQYQQYVENNTRLSRKNEKLGVAKN